MKSPVKLKVCFVAAILFLISLFGCSDSSVENAENAWKELVRTFDPIGKTKDETVAWLIRNGEGVTRSPDSLSSILESIEASGLVCSHWHILFSAKLDKKEIVVSYQIKTLGTCL